jgi:CheY-like chemotaxis protein
MNHRILHVEDNPHDLLLIGMAFRKAGMPATMDVATDGDKAIAALSKGGSQAAPACILLDIKLPTSRMFFRLRQ